VRAKRAQRRTRPPKNTYHLRQKRGGLEGARLRGVRSGQARELLGLSRGDPPKPPCRRRVAGEARLRE
jgi:hypothetical protein